MGSVFFDSLAITVLSTVGYGTPATTDRRKHPLYLKAQRFASMP